MMNPADQARLEELAQQAETVEEDEPQGNGHIATARDMLPQAKYRYVEHKIFGIKNLVRFRTLTAAEFVTIKSAPDKVLLLHAVVDEEGRQCFSPEILDALIDEWDAQTYLEMINRADDHCFNKSLNQMVEEQAGN